MSKKAFWLSTIAVLISFAGGFLLANGLNRKELEDLRAEVGRLKSNPPAEAGGGQSLSDEEIREKIHQADRNPENIDYQKNLALALYRYAEMKQEPNWLPEVARLLTRAHEKNPGDFGTIVSLANVYFSLGQAQNEPGAYEKSRDYFRRALELKPDDAETRSDLGATYLYAAPPDYEKAAEEFEKALKIQKNNERALQNMVQAQIGAGNLAGAEAFLERLRRVNPNSEALPKLGSQIEQIKNGRQKQ